MTELKDASGFYQSLFVHTGATNRCPSAENGRGLGDSAEHGMKLIVHANEGLDEKRDPIHSGEVEGQILAGYRLVDRAYFQATDVLDIDLGEELFSRMERILGDTLGKVKSILEADGSPEALEEVDMFELSYSAFAQREVS